MRVPLLRCGRTGFQRTGPRATAKETELPKTSHKNEFRVFSNEFPVLAQSASLQTTERDGCRFSSMRLGGGCKLRSYNRYITLSNRFIIRTVQR